MGSCAWGPPLNPALAPLGSGLPEGPGRLPGNGAATAQHSRVKFTS